MGKYKKSFYKEADIDNEVLIQANTNFLRVGEFFDVKIIEASATISPIA
jgi:hypothetical protein